jgi:hypothetical protein
MNENGNQSSHTPTAPQPAVAAVYDRRSLNIRVPTAVIDRRYNFEIDGALQKQIPVRNPEMDDARTARIWDKAMTFRNLFAIGLVNPLFCAGFSGNALGGSFTNGDFFTYDQGDWGDTQNNTNAAVLLAANYDTVYASSSGVLEVGIPGSAGFSMLFTGAAGLLEYLPDVGTLGPLDADYIDPTSTASGSFGGEVTALKLNIDFSDAGVLRGNLDIHFGDLLLQNFSGGQLRSLNGLTVRHFAAGMNNLLGGGTFFIPLRNFTYHTNDIPDLYPIVANLNSSFGSGGFINSGYATDHLAVAQVPLVMQAASHSGNSITLTWSTTPASMYQVQFITDLTQTNWTNLGSPIRATNFTWTASNTTTNSQKFYRIDQLP